MSKCMTLKDSNLLDKLVERANENVALLNGAASSAPLEQLIKDHAVVFAIWQDRREYRGVGCRLIKGGDIMRDVAVTGRARRASTTAIPVDDHEQAIMI